jgi:c-di-GMP-binding flagellar brake protein YcgR
MMEQRLFTRFLVKGEVLIKLEEKAESIKADLVDISFNGAGVFTRRMIEPDTLVKFFISGKLFERHISGEGKIKYVRAYTVDKCDIYRMGIEFINVDSNLIRDVLMHLQEKLLENMQSNT